MVGGKLNQAMIIKTMARYIGFIILMSALLLAVLFAAEYILRRRAAVNRPVMENQIAVKGGEATGAVSIYSIPEYPRSDNPQELTAASSKEKYLQPNALNPIYNPDIVVPPVKEAEAEIEKRERRRRRFEETEAAMKKDRAIRRNSIMMSDI